MSALTATVPLEQHPAADAVKVGLDIINRCMPRFADYVHAIDLAELKTEAARLEGLPTSRVIRTMRQIVDGELTARDEAVDRA